MISMFSFMKYNSQSAISLRQESLAHNSEYWQLLKHPMTCFICLQRNVEHHPEYGYAICDMCVSIFGTPTKGREYYYDIATCPLCRKPVRFQARLLPPTCRVRFVGFDRGGSRGIVSLVFMEELSQTLDLPYPVQEHFDYSIRTSSGAIISPLSFRDADNC
jgi:hypothetical protein